MNEILKTEYNQAISVICFQVLYNKSILKKICLKEAAND